MEPSQRGVDPVLVLVRSVRERLSLAGLHKPKLRMKVTLGFVAIAALMACAGSRPSPLLIGVLLSVALVQELPGALLARWSGRSARVSIDVLGGNTEVSEPITSPGLKLGLASIGSFFSLAVGGAHLLAASRLAHAPVAGLLSEAGQLHMVWGAVHLLPFVPFKLGTLVASQLSGRARARHAVTSLLFALALLFVSLGKLGSPLVFVALSVLIWSCCRHVLESWALAHDASLDAEKQLQSIEALTLAGDTRRAIRLAQQLRELVRSAPLRARVGCALAWAAIGEGNAPIAAEALLAIPPASVDLHLLSSYLGTSGRAPEAIRLLETARASGVRTVETTKLLVDLYYRERRLDDVATLAATSGDVLSATELSQIEAALAMARPSSRERPLAETHSDVAGHVLVPDAR
jgi:hypothetical protein